MTTKMETILLIATLESDLVQGQTNITVTYFDQNNNSLSSPFPSTFTTGTQTIKRLLLIIQL
jgi:hypothetical protein